MKAVGWHNGNSDRERPAGYGIRVSKSDRDAYFNKEWSHVTLQLGQTRIRVALTNSFWKKCPELRSGAIGTWLLADTLAPWPWHQPPQLKLEPMGVRAFSLSR